MSIFYTIAAFLCNGDSGNFCPLLYLVFTSPVSSMFDQSWPQDALSLGQFATRIILEILSLVRYIYDFIESLSSW
jgi:hypothetical protein